MGSQEPGVDDTADPSEGGRLRFDELQDPGHDSERDPVREFKQDARQKRIQTILIILAAVVLMLPVIWWVLQQPV